MKLYPYQEHGVDFLVRRSRAYLADDCGVGKTAQAAVAAGHVECVRPLVIAPASALPNWFRHWRELGVSAPLEAESYTKLALHPHMFDDYDPDLVILDEAHYVKSARAKRSAAALHLAQRADRAWLLSATPSPNHLGELYAPIKALWPGVCRQLGIRNEFHWRNKFTNWSQDFGGRIRIHGSRNGSLLLPFLGRLMLRRTLEEIGVELPPLRVEVSLLPKEDGFVEALERAGVDGGRLLRRIELEDASVDGSTSRLRRLVGEYKAPKIAQLVATELDDRQYDKIVIMAHHTSVIKLFERVLRRFGVVQVTGETTRAEREAAENAFSTNPEVRVFIGQQTAAGISLNLQVAHEMVLVEPSWTPDDNYQAVKRIHRIGSTRSCRARLFAVDGTLDEAIINITARKTRTKLEAGL